MITMSQRLDYFALSPKASGRYAEFSMLLTRSPFLAPLAHLVMLRASQINGCAYCLDMHTKDARALGETEQRIYALSAWRETSFFSDRERAALAWAEANTLLPQGVSQQLFEEVREQFSEAQLANLTLAIATINAWNRFGVSFAPVPGSYQPD